MTTVVEPLVGSQTPRVRSVPASSLSFGVECVEFAAQAGLFMDPWQADVLVDSMGVQAGGVWTAAQVGLLVPRQNGKGSILEARELFGLFVLASSTPRSPPGRRPAFGSTSSTGRTR